MPDQSPVLALPLIQPAQAQKHITHNEALLVLDALVQLGVESFDSAAPPATPAAGARHIVGTGATGDWAGQDGSVALWTGDLWRFFVPKAGWRADHIASGTTLRHDGTGWQATTGSGPVDQLGIGGAIPDAGTRLAVRADAVLLDHDTDGDHRLKINRAGVADTASLLFQTGYAGGAEMGLAGSGDWSVKVSPDGTAWTEALAFDATTGAARGAAVQTGPQDTTPDRLATVGGSYGPATLIGTVSEANGLPSGAVIESGADGTGGHYLRLADGSQVCWGTLTAAAQDMSTASGGAFTGTAITGSFAAPFAAAPALTVSDRLVDGTADIWTVVTDVTASGFGVLPVALSARVQDRMITYTARGQAPGIGGASGAAPMIDGLPAIAGTPQETATLSATAAPVTGDPAPLRGWEWLRDGTAITGADSASYTPGAADIGAMLSVRQTETNALGSASATSAAIGPVTGAAGGFDPVTLFGAGDAGLFLDFSDMSSLFTDLAGTAGVTATADPIRFVADLSGTGNNLNSQMTATSPTYTETGGLAGAFFAGGAAERLLASSAAGVTGLSNVDNCTMVVAYTTTAFTSGNNPLRLGSAAAGDYAEVYENTTSSSIRSIPEGMTVNNVATVDNSGIAVITAGVKDGSEGRWYKWSPAGGGLVETDSGLAVFAADFSSEISVRGNGNTIYAVFFINRAVTGAAFTNLIDWFKTKAGIA